MATLLAYILHKSRHKLEIVATGNGMGCQWSTQDSKVVTRSWRGDGGKANNNETQGSVASKLNEHCHTNSPKLFPFFPR